MMHTRIRRNITALTRVGTALAFLTGGGIPVLAQSASWSTTATAGGSWATPSNWQGGNIPSGSGNSATFALDFTAGASVTLDGNQTIGTILSSSANPWSLDPGSGGTLTVAGFNITGGGTLTVNTALAGVDFAKDGSGALTLTNPNANYTGVININAGTLYLVGSGNFSTNRNVVNLASGATLDVTQLASGLRYGGDPSTRLAVNDGDQIDGTGTVNGGLKVSSGGTVYPGINGVGTLTVKGAVDFSAGSNWQVKFSTANAGGSNVSNVISVNAKLSLEDGMNMPIDGNGLTFSAGQTYDYNIATGASNINFGTVNFLPTNFDPSLLVSSSDFTLISGSGMLTLQFTPTPEPAFVMAVCFGVVAGFGVLRRLKNQCNGAVARNG